MHAPKFYKVSELKTEIIKCRGDLRRVARAGNKI